VGAEVAGGNTAKGVKKDLKNGEEAFDFKLPDITHQAIQDALKNSNDFTRFSLSDNPDGKPLMLTPYVVFSYVDEKTSRLWVVLKVVWMNNYLNTKEWTCRYFSGVDTPRPMTGEGGWTENHGALMTQALNENLKLAAQVMLEDLNGQLKDEKIPKEKMRGHWAFFKSPVTLDVQVLKKAPEWEVVLPQVSDWDYFAGVHIISNDFPEPLKP
jgi:hypothetical protein